MKPWSFTSAEKLDTQNGIANSRKVCHLSGLLPLFEETLNVSAMPMTPLIPADVIQILGLGSKYRLTTTRYQMR
jgi:hypothetical protein